MLFHHKFPRPLTNGDEIHSLRQPRHINLLGFSGDLACKDDLAHEVGDAVFRRAVTLRLPYIQYAVGRVGINR